MSRRRRATVLGITGGIACGKSEVGRILARHGVAVCDADDLAHAAMQPGGAAYRPVLREFGPGLRDAEGRIDRRRLGRMVFADPAARARLNELVHPAVALERARWLRRTLRTRRVAAVIVPLLYEVKAEAGCSAVVCVATPRPEALRRLRQRGLSVREAAQRIRAQMPLREKRRRADHVIENNGTKRELERKTLRVLKTILKEGA